MSAAVVNNPLEVLTSIESKIEKGASSFMNLMKDFNVIGFVLGLLLSNSVSEIANNLIDSVIMPTIKPFLDKVSRKNDTIEVGGMTLHLEKFINALIKFFVLALIIFVFISFGVTVTKPVSWVRIEEVNPNVSL